jgi:hypothetical protein
VKIKAISDVINGNKESQFDLKLSPEELASFKSSPITTCDVERSFSKYKQILSDRRLCFTEENLKYYFIVNCNAPFITNTQ